MSLYDIISIIYKFYKNKNLLVQILQPASFKYYKIYSNLSLGASFFETVQAKIQFKIATNYLSIKQATDEEGEWDTLDRKFLYFRGWFY